MWLTTEADDQSSLHCVIEWSVLGVEMQAVEVDAQRHQHTQANLNGRRTLEEHCQLPLYDVEKEVQHC